MDLYNELQIVVNSLQAAGIRFALCGGLALAFHGFVRFTQDIDLVVDESELEAAKSALLSSGYQFDEGILELGSQREPHDRTRIARITKIVGKELLVLDMILLNVEQAAFWDRVVSVKWEEHELRVISKVDLIAMKQRAGRPQDLVDIARLEATNAGT